MSFPLTRESTKPQPLAHDLAAFIHGITVHDTQYTLWTRAHSFNYPNYWTVLPLLQDLETQHSKTPAALIHLEHTVLDYLTSPNSRKDKDRFSLLMMPGRMAVNGRLKEDFEEWLKERLIGERKNVRVVLAREAQAGLMVWWKGVKVVSLMLPVLLTAGSTHDGGS